MEQVYNVCRVTSATDFEEVIKTNEGDNVFIMSSYLYVTRFHFVILL